MDYTVNGASLGNNESIKKIILRILITMKIMKRLEAAKQMGCHLQVLYVQEF